MRSRRNVSIHALVIALAGACFSGAVSAQPFQEAPLLAERVKSGALPALEQRLPQKPEVIADREVGNFGGDIRRGLRGSSDHNGILKMVGNQGLTRWSIDFTKVLPNVAESWMISPDASEYTFKLRAGLKWSDGQPFTSDDVAFFFEDLLVNPEFYKAPPARYTIDGKPAAVEKVDASTIKIKFAGPYGMFLQELATPLGQEPTLWAKHYCKQFHPKYNPNVADLVKREGVSDWAALFRAKCGDIEIPTRWGNPERPTVDPWVVTREAYTGGATRVVMERNPYFWQVDKQGRQLPYADRVVMGIAQDTESLVLETINGRIDYQDRHINTPANKPVLIENQQKGKYKVFDMRSSNSNRMGLFLNLTHKDAATRELFNNKDFRVALSLGIDRSEIIEVVHLGQGEPRQIGPLNESPLYNERLAKQYINHDPKQANALLDKIGLTRKDGDGFRLRPDGKRVRIEVNVIPNLYPDLVDILEMMKGQWAEIGVDLNVNVLERSIFYQRADAVEFDALVWPVGGGSGNDVFLAPREVIAVHPQGTWFAIPWATWYNTGGKAGSEPNESMKKRLALWDQFKKTADPARQEALFRQILDLAADAFEVIGITSGPAQFGVASAALKNVPQGVMTEGWTYPNPGPALPQVFFFDRTAAK